MAPSPWSQRTRGDASRLVAWCGVLLALAWPAGRALAHDPPQIARIVWQPDRADVLLQTNRGLIFGDPAARDWRILCNEAMRINGGELPSIAYAPGGRLLVATSTGLRSTGDEGCSWEIAFEGLLVPAMAQDPAQPSRLYIATFPLGMASENVSGDSAIRASSDGGGSWTDLIALPDNDFVNSLRVAPSRPERVYSAGTVYFSDHRDFYVSRSDDSGETWTRFTRVPAADDYLLELLAVSPVDPDFVVAKITPNAPLTIAGTLLISRDGGETFEEAARVMMLRDAGFAADGSTIWLAAGEGILRSDDGASFARVGAAEEMTCAVEHDGALHACGWFEGRGAGAHRNGVGRSEDLGDSYQPWMTFQDVKKAVACGDGTQTDAVCQVPFQDWRYEVENMFSPASLMRDGGVPPIADAGGSDAGAAEAAVPEADAGAPAAMDAGVMPRDGGSSGGCGGCTPGGGGAAPRGWLALALVLLALGRRRSRC